MKRIQQPDLPAQQLVIPTQIAICQSSRAIASARPEHTVPSVVHRKNVHGRRKDIEGSKVSTVKESVWSRRQILGAFAASAVLPARNAAAASSRRVGVVGGGMAGVSLAFLLNGERHVVLLEAAASLGGNVQSVEVELDGQSFAVDIGAQYFNPALYPNYVNLVNLLGLSPEVHLFPASITEFSSGEAKPRFLSPLLPGRAWPLLESWNLPGLKAFTVAFENAKKREAQDADWNVTMEEWLATLDFSDDQMESTLLPWTASLYSGITDEARGLSARAAMIFVAKTLPDNPLSPISYYVLNPGMSAVVNAMIARCSTVDVMTSAQVTVVTRAPQGGFLIRCTDGRTIEVDDLVFASSGPATLPLLQGLPDTAAQQTALASMEFRDAVLALHTDPIYAPANPVFRSFFNARVHGNYCEASMWLKNVLAVPRAKTAAKVWKSWITYAEQSPANVLAQARYKHMLPTPATLKAQNDLLALQGQGDVWFVGGYTRPYDSQETALLSAGDVAQALLSS
jgi:predicted NAD/FAD-binding protein